MRDLCADRNELTAPVLRLLKCRVECIVSIAKLFPFGSDNNRFRSIDYTIRVLGENNGKSGLEMPLSSESVNKGRGGVWRVFWMGGENVVLTSIWQWRNQGPGLSALKRMRTSDPPTPTTSRRGGLTKFVGPFMLLMTWKAWPWRWTG